jgi:hypothetical protein
MASNSVLRSIVLPLFAVFVVFAGMACGGSDNTTSTIECVHDWEWTLNAVEATCVEPSKDTAVCKNAPCDATDVREGATPATGVHTYGEWQINAIAPTETDDNKDARTCTVCSSKEARPTTGTVEYATGTAGLAFEAIGTAAYRVRAGTVTSGVVHIPRFHRPNASSDYLPVTEIGANNDWGNGGEFASTGIAEVNFLEPSNITLIGGWAFNHCTALTSVTIPNSVTTIGGSAFNGCTGLTSITIPNSVTTIGSGAFAWCTSLTSITVDAVNPNFASQNGVLYNKAMTTLLRMPAGITGSFTISNSVTTIGLLAFSGCPGLTSVVIPNSVATIGVGAFDNCTGLTSVTIGNGVTSIEGGAFWNCPELTSVTVLRETPPTLVESAFGFDYASLQIFVPAGSVDAYKAAAGWIGYADRIEAITP